jgi:hypothetical protein
MCIVHTYKNMNDGHQFLANTWSKLKFSLENHQHDFQCHLVNIKKMLNIFNLKIKYNCFNQISFEIKSFQYGKDAWVRKS